MARLTTTSYAILGLLSVRRWSAYELTSQMKRGMRFTWPRAETRIYGEPKNLVRHGLARARTERNGKRRRTVYSITDKGRTELARWLEQPSAPPQLECEAVLRATFADSGTREGLLRTLRQLRDQAAAYHDEIAGQAEDYLATGGPFPDRLHIIAIVGKFIVEYLAHVERWATWAEAEVERWPAVGPASQVPVAEEVFHELLASVRSRS